MIKKAHNNPLSYINKVDIIKKNVPDDYLLSIIDSINILFCRKGQQFILEGTPVSGLFFICEGKAKVLKTGINGREQILRFVTEGEIVGHRGFGSKRQYEISAFALDDTVLCNFSNATLEKMLREIPNLTYDFMMFYADELSKSESKVKAIAQMTVREKVIDTLLYINRKFGENLKGYLNLQLSRKEIAGFAGTTEEQVIRTLSSLKKEEQIQTLGKRIKIVNVENLSKEISEHNFFINS
tara:strand:- start:2 stop:721 length:720 start_codon:yes stop_codon:yes gene_type:complete